ncbi:hypothetical protein MFIFM68171_08156 [Madurella fahalii]|uniref:Uncharacterized protein n=1 Tax=Madurella fahalii TaxID=1157608 RepID=A0ABQ0GJQ1_9PEZI
MLDCDHAWSDALNIWRTYDRGRIPFSESIFDTFQGPRRAQCNTLFATTTCNRVLPCSEGEGIGPAAYGILNSLIDIHQIYSAYFEATLHAADQIYNRFRYFQHDFAPLLEPESAAASRLLANLVGLGAVMTAVPILNPYLEEKAFFVANQESPKDATYGFLSAFISTLRELDTDSGQPLKVHEWSEEKYDDFESYVAQFRWSWPNATELAVRKLFDGSDESIQTLTTMISKGKMMEGSYGGHERPTDRGFFSATMRSSALKTFYTLAIPATWTQPAVGAFVMDSGVSCDDGNPLAPELNAETGRFLSADTANATWACYNNKLYYLVHTGGEAQGCQSQCGDVGCIPQPHCKNNRFSMPPGIDELGTAEYGYITVRDLIMGSVRTYERNGKRNGGPTAQISDKDTVYSLIDQDITAPGIVNIPICGPAEAFSNWNNPVYSTTRYSTFPCNKMDS